MTTVRVDGWPVAPGTADAFLGRLKPAFESQFPGVTLHVYSGYRSYEDQVKIFLERYVRWEDVDGRTIYDKRLWDGVWWYRISPAGTVAQPGTSNHQSGHALDIRDSGADAGVTRAGNARSNWIRAHAHEYGFNPAGYSFSEPWHIEYTGEPWTGGSGGGGSAYDYDTLEDDMTAQADIQWIKDQLGGSNSRDTSLRQDVDRIEKQVKANQADIEWIKTRIGGTYKGDSVTDMLRDIKG